MASIIIADENEGRRNLLGNTFEREGYEVTRLGTLAQTTATAAAVMPDVVLIEGEWSQGSALDACSTMNNEARFRNSSRVVLLSRTTAPDFLSSAALAGVAEVIGKPIDMNQLIGQIGRHASKQFVAPPAELSQGGGGGLASPRFDVGMTMNDSQWALPMLRRLVEAGNIDETFVASLQDELGDGHDAVDVSAETMTNMVRLALNRLVGQGKTDQIAPPVDPQASSNEGPASATTPSFNDLNRGATLGEGAAPTSASLSTSMEDILERQANDIAEQVEREMDTILDEEPDYVALLETDQQVTIDPETLELTRLTGEVLLELFRLLQRPGTLSDWTLLTQIEDAERLTTDLLEALPAKEEEE